jgi:hypothetical protein
MKKIIQGIIRSNTDVIESVVQGVPVLLIKDTTLITSEAFEITSKTKGPKLLKNSSTRSFGG